MTRRQILGVSMVLLAVAGAAAGCNLHNRPAVERKSRPVAGATSSSTLAAETSDADIVVAPGIVEAWGDQVDLSSQESGWIGQLAVREGERVRAGQLLAVLEDSAERHAVRLAEADLAEAQAVLARVERGATAEELQQARSDAAAAASRRDIARATAERTAKLLAEGVVPLDRAERDAAEARTELALAERADARFLEVRRGAREEDRAVARARLDSARARLLVAEDARARRRILAPTAGTILLSRLHAGEFYAVGSGPMFVLGDISRLQVRLEVDEIDAPEINPGAACAVYSDLGARVAEGRVIRLAPKMGRRRLGLETPTDRVDLRVREVFVEVPAASKLIPGQRVWGHAPRSAKTLAAR